DAQRLARREAHHATRRNRDRRTGLRVAPAAGAAPRHGEGPESDEAGAVALLERPGDLVEETVDDEGDAHLRHLGVARDPADNLGLVHARTPLPRQTDEMHPRLTTSTIGAPTPGGLIAEGLAPVKRRRAG